MQTLSEYVRPLGYIVGNVVTETRVGYDTDFFIHGRSELLVLRLDTTHTYYYVTLDLICMYMSPFANVNIYDLMTMARNFET